MGSNAGGTARKIGLRRGGAWRVAAAERSVFHNGGNKAVDPTIVAKGSTFEHLVIGSNTYNPSSFDWRGVVGFTYLRMGILSDSWIAAEYSNLNTPSGFYSIGAEVAA